MEKVKLEHYNIGGVTFDLTFTDNYDDWRMEMVKRKGDDKCVMCGRKGDAAHIIPRCNPVLRFAVENGVFLCRAHHRQFDSLNSTNRKKLACVIAGTNRVDNLYAVTRKKVENKVWE